MASKRTNLLALLLLVAPLAACGVETTAVEEMPLLPGEGKADSNANTPAGRAILFELKDLYKKLRPLKAELIVGETYNGYVAVVPSAAAKLAQDTARSAEVETLLEQVNDARRRWYDLEVAKYKSQILSGIMGGLSDVRRQAMEKVCADLGLPVGANCANVGASQIDSAMQTAVDKALEAAMAKILRGVEVVHADFWMSKTTKAGEYIQLRDKNGEYVWFPKPAKK